MAIFRDVRKPNNETYQATARKDIFVFRERHGEDTIQDFALDDKIRFVDFAGTFRDLTFAVDTTAQTITLRYDGSGNQITLRDAAALIGSDGASLLTAANFHFVQTDPDGIVREGAWDPVELRGGKGDDTLTGSWENDELHGRKGDDTLDGGDGDDILHGGKGQDILEGSWGDDELHGGQGDDTLAGGPDDDILHGGKGGDTLRGDSGDDILYGGKGQDFLHGGWGDNRLVGGKGDDTLVSSRGADTFVFREGDGHDTIEDFGFGWSGSDGYFLTLESREAAEVQARANGALDSIEIHLKLPAAMLVQIKAQGEDTVIRYGAGDDTITLEGVGTSSLTLDDFDFVFVG